jgi:RHS repeat-associated protein
VLALNSSGAVTAVALYEPYGQVNSAWGSMPTAYAYTGQRLDSQSGLLYYQFRWYDPLSDEFARTDTKQNNANGMDPYAYVSDNPETKNDPTGHWGWDWGTVLTVVAVVAVVAVVVVVAVVAAPVIMAAAGASAEVAADVTVAAGVTEGATDVAAAGTEAAVAASGEAAAAAGGEATVAADGEAVADAGAEASADTSADGATNTSSEMDSGDQSGGDSQENNPSEQKTNQDLYRRLNKFDKDVSSSTPTGQSLRYPPDHTPSGVFDVGPDSEGNVPPGQGYSFFNKPFGGGSWSRLPAGVPIPEGTEFTPPGPDGHSLFTPTVPILLNDFINAFDTFSEFWE